jgi:HEPN domain-containing protein
VKAKIAFTKTHDLERLLDLILVREPAWDAFRPQLVELTTFAVAFRYPGDSATRELAKLAVKNCRAIRLPIRSSLGLPKP